MAKLTLADVSNLLGNPTSAATTINSNNTLVETALENTLSRDGTTPNQMLADIDLNNNDLLNVGQIDADTFVLNGVAVVPTELAETLVVGRDIGEILEYEDFGGFPTIFTDDRIIFRKETPTVTDVWNVAVLRDASDLTGGTPGFVNAALLVDTTVDTVDSFEWAFLSKLTVNGAGGGEHVAGYFQGIKNADNSVWSLCTEIRDFTTNPTTGSLGIEVGLFVTGTDGNEVRHGIDISVGSADNGQGTNVAASAIRIGPSLGDPLRAQLTNGIQLKGRIGTTIDMSQVDVSYSDITVKVPTNGKLSWRDSDQTERGTLAWNAVVDTWQISGVKTQAGAGAVVTRAVIQVNGTEYAIDLQALS